MNRAAIHILAVSTLLGTFVPAFSADLPRASEPPPYADECCARIPTVPYVDPVEVGAILPRTIPLSRVPDRYGILDYKYAVVNNKRLLVDPRSREIVDILAEQ